MTLREECKEMGAYIVDYRRRLHAVPEVGSHLPETSAIVMRALGELGIPCRKNAGDDGVVALIEGRHTNKVLAIRADMDALPIQEQTGLPFASGNGAMHACGHDAHAAILLGTARVLLAHRGELNGSVKLLFQTAEEQGVGAQCMMTEGALEDPHVNALIGLHGGVLLGDVLASGQFGIVPGPIMAAMDRFVIRVRGVGGHGSTPEHCVDPVFIASHIVCALQGIISRELPPVRPGVVTVGIVAGGNAFNIIPEEVLLEGTFRTLTEQDRTLVAGRIEAIATGIAATMRGQAEVEIHLGPPPVVNEKGMAAFAADCVEHILGEGAVRRTVDAPSMVGEDVAYYLRERPGAYLLLGTGTREKGTFYPHHNPRFDLDEDVLWRGCAAFAQIALEYLGEREPQ